jgi:hypothetical protein
MALFMLVGGFDQTHQQRQDILHLCFTTSRIHLKTISALNQSDV